MTVTQNIETAGPAPDVRALLEVADLTVAYGGRYAPPALDGVNLSVRRGEILGVIGETGSGKTTLARSIVGLVPPRRGRITFAGTEIGALRGRNLREFRRRGEIQFVFQDPLRALDPEIAVADSVAEPLAVSGAVDRAARTGRAAEALRAVGLDEALAERLPGRLSGGQRQRALLARALVTGPRLLIADEPVSALDAANRNHVLRLLLNLRDESGVAVVVISHDLHSLAGVADRVAVLHAGRIAEQGPVRDVLDNPQHPYTIRLVAAAPRLRAARAARPAPVPVATAS